MKIIKERLEYSHRKRTQNGYSVLESDVVKVVALWAESCANEIRKKMLNCKSRWEWESEVKGKKNFLRISSSHVNERRH